MPPGPQDWWFARHNAECGGRYIKVLEPPEKPKPVKTPALRKKTVHSKERDPKNNSTLDQFLASIDSKTKKSLADIPSLTKGPPAIKPVPRA